MSNKIKSEKKVPTFDSSKSYKWEGSAEFVLSGNEFEFLYNVLKKAVYSTGIAPIEIMGAFDTLHKIFISGIEGGVITPNEESKQ